MAAGKDEVRLVEGCRTLVIGYLTRCGVNVAFW